jgi:hypothetical protein
MRPMGSIGVISAGFTSNEGLDFLDQFWKIGTGEPQLWGGDPIGFDVGGDMLVMWMTHGKRGFTGMRLGIVPCGLFAAMPYLISIGFYIYGVAVKGQPFLDRQPVPLFKNQLSSQNRCPPAPWNHDQRGSFYGRKYLSDRIDILFIVTK